MRSMMFVKPVVFALCFCAAPAWAHPHVFVDATVELVFDDQNQMTGVRLVWTYDEFFSLLLAQDLLIDADADGELTETETAQLTAMVANWPPEFLGDLYIMQNDAPAIFAAPVNHTVVMQQGRVIETHFRPLTTPLIATTPITVQVYDPSYYTAYDLTGVTLAGGQGCATALQAADKDTADKMTEALLFGRPADQVGPDEQFPEVGHAYADTITVTCDTSF